MAMCGGLTSAFGMRARMLGRTAPVAFFHASTYQIGRLSSYALAGALCGAFGSMVQNILNLVGLALWLRVLAGALLVALGLQVALGWHLLQPLERLGAKVWRRLSPLTQGAPRQGLAQALFIGALWGWLPCGLVYSMLLLGALGGSPLHGAAVMLAFGAGTLPAMLSSSLLSSQLTRITTGSGVHNNFKWLAGALMLGLGVWTAWMALAHLFAHSGHHT
jgi:sulfite exporter TauE/SafE